jgi:hypothetical protein
VEVCFLIATFVQRMRPRRILLILKILQSCQKEKESGLTPDYHYLTPEGAHFREILRCSLAQSNKYKLMRF